MRGKDFLEVARALVAGTSEAHRRAAVVNAYYALMLECANGADYLSTSLASASAPNGRHLGAIRTVA
jgi:hypothetical protein